MYVGRKIGITIITAYCFSAVFSCRTERIPAFSVLDNDVEHLMREYIAAHPEYDDFMLYAPMVLSYENQRLYSGVIISPILSTFRFIDFQFQIKMKGKNVYMTPSFNNIVENVPKIVLNDNVVMDHVHAEHIDPVSGEVTKTHFPGIYFEYRDGKVHNISDRPDTLFFGNDGIRYQFFGNIGSEEQASPENEKSLVSAREAEHPDYKVIRAEATILPALQSYLIREMARHPECNTFVLVRAPLFTRTGETRHAPEYLFGPASDSILSHRNLNCYQDFGDNRVFMLSEIFDIFESEPSRWKNRNPKESTVLDDGTVVKDSRNLFLLRSTLYSVDSPYNVRVNNRPDTLFLSGVQL